jgi:hypothetical protein
LFWGLSNPLSNGYGDCFPVVKWPGLEVDYAPLFGAESKNAWSCTFTPRPVFMAWFLIKHSDNYTSTIVLVLYVYKSFSVSETAFVSKVQGMRVTLPRISILI